MTRLFLIRHGESVAQVEGFLSGHDTCRGLSDLGRAQVTALRDRLARTGEIQADVLVTSILPRAIETAAIISPAIGGHEAIQDCDLCEVHVGEAEGLTWEEIGAKFPRPESFDADWSLAPGGESWNAFAARVARGLGRYAEAHEGKTIVAAVHGGVVEHSFTAFWGGTEHTPLGQLVNASITEWEYAPNAYRGGEARWRLNRYNDHAHLSDFSTTT